MVYSLMMWKSKSFISAYERKKGTILHGKVGFYNVSRLSGIIVKNNCSQSLATCIEEVCSMKNYSYKNIQRLNDINDYIKTIKKILY